MKYRFMRVENVILPLHPLTPGDTPHRDDRSRYMLIFGIGILAIATTVLLVILLSEKAGSYSQVVPHTMTPSKAADTVERLQILQLEQQTSAQAKFRSYIPLLSVMVVFLGGIFGAYKYFRDQDRDFALRIEQDISSNLNQLLDFTKETSGSQNARITSVLDNLSWLIRQAKEPPRQVRRVTAVIVSAIKEDIDFRNPREARFPALCLEHWPNYSTVVRDNEELQKFLSYRYNEALAGLAGKAPDYFAAIGYNRGGSFTFPAELNTKVGEAEHEFFATLVDGLWQHLRLVVSEEIRRGALAGFRRALNNPNLCAQLQNEMKIVAEVSVS
jgi:hypothetical protein